ncbi:hypothetical protein BF14_033785 [Streptomyces griseus]|nr:hypothetical protein BF14_033785 [Streptomyces griseus]
MSVAAAYMSPWTVHTTAVLLPAPAELRAYLRALALLDQAICRDPRFSRFSFSTTWGPGTEAAVMDNGSGDDFSVLFAQAGVLVRGFDHESEMSPYGTDDEQVWPSSTRCPPRCARSWKTRPSSTRASAHRGSPLACGGSRR